MLWFLKFLLYLSILTSIWANLCFFILHIRMCNIIVGFKWMELSLGWLILSNVLIYCDVWCENLNSIFNYEQNKVKHTYDFPLFWRTLDWQDLWISRVFIPSCFANLSFFADVFVEIAISLGEFLTLKTN